MSPTLMKAVTQLLWLFQIKTVIIPTRHDYDLETIDFLDPSLDAYIAFQVNSSSSSHQNKNPPRMIVISSDWRFEDIVPFQRGFGCDHWLIPSAWTKNISSRDNLVPLNSKVYFYTKDWIISEIYQVKGGPIKKNDIFQWNDTSETFEALTKLSFLQRRSNLSGTHINAITKSWGNLCHITFNEDGEPEFTGLYHMVFQAIAGLGGFSYTLVDYTREAFGKLLPNGSFSGIGGRVEKAEVDLGVYGFALLLERAPFFEMIQIYRMKFKVIMKSPPVGPSYEHQAYYKMFTFSSWISIVIVLGVSLLIGQLLFKHLTTFSNQVAFVATTFCQQTAQLPTVTISQRIFWITLACLGPFFFTFYSCMLVSNFTGKPPILRIDSYKDIFDLGYQISEWKDGNVYQETLACSTDPFVIALAKHSRPHESYEEALEWIREDPKLVAIASDEFFGDKNVYIGEFQDGLNIPMGFNFPLGSEFAEIFAYFSLRVFEMGIKDFETKKCTNRRTEVRAIPEPRFVPMEWSFLKIPLSVFLCGLFLSVLLAFGESTSFFKR